MDTIANVEKPISNAKNKTHSTVSVIARKDVPAITSVEVDGELHTLGEHRDFRRHHALQHFLPDIARLSVSWVNLKKGQELSQHQHPTPSMIIVCRGEGKLTGQINQTLHEGDIVTVPPQCSHGFIGSGNDGFDALSIQFGNEGGLYEDVDNALVKFIKPTDDFTLEDLLAHNKQRLEDIKNIRFFTLIKDGSLKDPIKRQKYLNNLEIWTIRNQLLLFSRQATCTDKKYEKTFLQHFTEEIGHDELYSKREEKLHLQDPVIEAIASWFVHQMFTADNIEKAAIIHLVIENTSDYYHSLAKSVLTEHVNEEYYEAHLADTAHAQMGVDMLSGETAQTYRRLVPVIDKAWDMITAMMDRVAYLTEHN